MQYPKQAANVYAEQLDNEVCVYDWEQKQMHALNPTAALVWEQCDGKTDPAQMAARLQSELNVPNADKLVALSLNRLQKAQLLEGTAPQTQRTITRREVLKMAGIGLALLPVVSSIALPSAAQAQSCTPNCNYTISKPDGVDCVTACEDYISIFTGHTLCSADQSANPTGTPLCECYTYSGGSGCIVT